MEFNNLSINSISYKSYKEKINNLKIEIPVWIDPISIKVYENIEIFNGSIISNNTILEGTDAVGKTTTITELLKEGIICQDRCMDVISVNMLFDISMEERVMKYQEYLRNIDKKIIIMVNNNKEELEKRINEREKLSEFDTLAYEYNQLYMETYNYMKNHNMLEDKMFLVNCTGLTVDEQVNTVKKIICKSL